MLLSLRFSYYFISLCTFGTWFLWFPVVSFTFSILFVQRILTLFKKAIWQCLQFHKTFWICLGLQVLFPRFVIMNLNSSSHGITMGFIQTQGCPLGHFFFVARYRYVHLESNTLSPLTLRDIWTLPTANEFSVATIIRIFNFLRQLLLVEWQVHTSSIHFFSIVVPRSHGFVAAPRNVRAALILNFPLV